MHFPQHVRRRLGFTLAELLVVIFILALLGGLVATWAISAIQGAKINRTYSVMGSVLATTDLLKVKSPIQPDHRLANLYWVRPHTSPPAAMTSTAGARQMSSMEFLVFLAFQFNPTSPMVASQGSSLQPSPVPAAWGDLPSGLVDVYEQNPMVGNVLHKAKCPGGYDPQTGALAAGAAQYTLASNPAGYPLKSLFDAWGHELVYRQRTFARDLNGEDTTDTSSPNYTSRHEAEAVVQDEAVAAANAMGPVLPAVAGYAHPMVISAGRNGQWGAFVHPDASTPRRDATADKTTERNVEAQDNLYSQEKNQ